MIKEAEGNLLEADTGALVNAVNCVGVMGKGLAMQFRRRFSEEYFKDYKRACQNTVCKPARSAGNIEGLTNFKSMKKSIIAILLIIAVCAVASLAQTKKRTVTRTTKRGATTTTVRKTTVKAVRQEAVTTPSGLTYIITKRGTGAPIKAGDEVIVNYTGLLTNGVKFDSSLDGGEPFSFPVGAGRVIKGWDEGLQKLRIGDRATLIIPASIGYGSRGAGNVIPPDATLIFIIEVIGVK